MTQQHFLISDLHEGMQRTFVRVVTEADLHATMALTGDLGGYHTDEAFARAAGFRTVIVPGLFQAGMVTRLGGELNYLAREIRFGYVKPVYVGDRLTCTATVTALEPARNRMEMRAEVVNQDGVCVLEAHCKGYLPRADWGVPTKPAWP